MIERVARAILKRRFYDCEPDMYVDLDWFFWVMENESGDIWSDAQDEARAAIEAMREPTEAMRAARFRVRGRGGQAEWEAMIDQALKDDA